MPCQFGMIGLAVMGANLAQNVEDHGFSVAVWNREPTRVDEFIAQNRGKNFTGTKSLEEYVAALERPRRMMMLIKAGTPVDQTIDRLTPLMEEGDILIDGGNSWLKDTQRRTKQPDSKNLHFVGSAVSAGQQGACSGPSPM